MASESVSKVKKTAGDSWDQLASPKRPAHDSWEAGIRQIDDPQQLQAEMDSLSQEYEAEQKSSLLEHYAFIPDHPHVITYITENFLHGGWLHLIGNLWFLRLAGLEQKANELIVPHAEWDSNIRSGIQAAEQACGVATRRQPFHILTYL
ncbi:MAG TPA: rhomboid family intramembrane serine protease [Candidatus Acidoferrum sp.]